MTDKFDTGKPCYCNEGGICSNCYDYQFDRAERAETELSAVKNIRDTLQSDKQKLKAEVKELKAEAEMRKQRIDGA